MTLFQVRERAASLLRPLAGKGKSPFDLGLADVVRQLSELADGWTMLEAGRYQEAAAFARTRLESRSSDNDAQRLIAATLEAKVKADIASSNTEALEECLEWFVGVPLPRSCLAPLRDALAAIGQHGGAKRARWVFDARLARLDPSLRNPVQSRVLYQMAREHFARNELAPTARILIDAVRLDPTDTEIERLLDVSAHNLMADLVNRSSANAALEALAKLGGDDLKPVRAAKAHAIAAQGAGCARAGDYQKAEGLMLEALKTLPPGDASIDDMNRSLGNILLSHAAKLIHSPYNRELAFAKLLEAARLGSKDAKELLDKISPPVSSNPFLHQYGRYR
jgi:tetratricopeptide (TPR) repeat protein